MTGRTDEKTGGQRRVAAPGAGTAFIGRYHHPMDVPAWLPVILSALIGTSGVVAAVARLAQLSEPAKLRKRIEGATALLKTDLDDRAKEVLRLACERDAYRLATMSIVQSKTQHFVLVRSMLVALIPTLTFIAIAVLLVPAAFKVNLEGNVFTNTEWANLVAVIGAIFSIIIFLAWTFALNMRVRRERLAARLFAEPELGSSYIRSHVARDSAPPTRRRRGTASEPQG